MNQLLTRTTLGVLLSFGALSVAQARWSTDVAPPDVFGNRKVVAAVSGKNGDGLVVQCNQKNVLELAYVFPVTPKQRARMKSDGPLPVTLLLTTDSGKIMNFKALKRVWNKKYGGYVVYGRMPSLMKAIKAISLADIDISVSVPGTGPGASGKMAINGKKKVDVPLTDLKASGHFTARGSTLAMHTAMRVCDLSNIPASKPGGKAKGEQPKAGHGAKESPAKPKSPVKTSG